MMHSMPLKNVSGQSYKSTIRTFGSSLVGFSYIPDAVNVLKFQKLFSFCSQIKLPITARIFKMLVRMANREDPDQTASSEAV